MSELQGGNDDDMVISEQASILELCQLIEPGLRQIDRPSFTLGNQGPA